MVVLLKSIWCKSHAGSNPALPAESVEMYTIKRSNREIDEVLNKAWEVFDTGNSKYPGMTYEDGLKAMFKWLTEDNPEFSPMDD